MESKNDAPNYTMLDIYKVLKFLPKSQIDRQEPCFFECIEVEGSSVVIATNHEDFDGIDYVQVYVNCQGVDVDVSTVSLSFSPLVNGNASLISLNCVDTEIDTVNDTAMTFIVDRNNTPRDKSRYLTGIESLKLDFGSDVTGVKILKIVVRSKDYTYTKNDIEQAIINGEDYVLRRLNNMSNEKRNIKEIPDLLKEYKYMAAGAYAWLTRWENEAKPMKEPKSESNNYADRLFGQVDSGIENYLSNIENNRNQEYLDLRQVATADILWGIR